MPPSSIRSSHSFPSFYACYLLKSVQTPQSTSIYIGSTPSPPRRIRQHNGELAQGARKTQLKRPWVMQMIVHGFPSRLAALQFEWAWQHPHKSRHMRDGKISIFGSRAHKTLQKNILIVRTMISRSPYITWPLHVKLFTPEAHQYWKDSMTNDIASPLPLGFTCTLELEGVDGKSGHPGSGRQGSISVNDEEFISTILAKNTAIAATGENVECAVCHDPILNYTVSPLSTALCPSSKCHAVSHLTCLSQSFINQEDRPTTIVPRGGYCKSCKQYTLWGDIIRGCYRRMPPSEVATPPLDIDTDDMFVSDSPEVQDITQSSRRRKKSPPTKPCKSSKEKGKQSLCPSSPSIGSESEIFDLSNLVTSSESEDIPGPVKKKPRRPRKTLAALSPPTIPQLSSKGSRKPEQPANSVSTSTLDLSNLAASSEIEDNATLLKGKGGRSRRDLAVLSPGATSSVLSPQPPKAFRTRKRSVSPSANPKPCSKGKGNQPFMSLSMSEGETSDFYNLATSFGCEATSTPVKRKRGRPIKDVPLPVLSPGVTSPIVSTRPHIPLDITTKRPKGRTPTNCQELLKEKGKQKTFSPISLITSSEDENFALNNLVASPEREDPSTPIKRQRGRPRKNPAVVSLPIEPGQSSEGKEQNSESTNIASRSVDIPSSIKIKPRRSPANMGYLSLHIPSPVSSTQPHKPPRSKDVPGLTRSYHDRCKGVEKAESEDSSARESFDFGDVSDQKLTRNRYIGSNHGDVRTTKTLRPQQREVNPLKLGVGTRDLGAMHRLEHAMSAISLAPLQTIPFHTDQSYAHEVIEVSD